MKGIKSWDNLDYAEGAHEGQEEKKRIGYHQSRLGDYEAEKREMRGGREKHGTKTGLPSTIPLVAGSRKLRARICKTGSWRVCGRESLSRKG